MSDLGIEFEEDAAATGRRLGRPAQLSVYKPKMIVWLNKYGLGDDAARAVLIGVSMLFFGISIALLVIHFVF